MSAVNWKNDAIQFPRLIAELEAAGAFTPAVYAALEESMNLDTCSISEIIERAQAKWDAIKRGT